MQGAAIQKEFTITEDDVIRFAELTGDWNPIHFNDAEAQKAGFEKRIVHGMLVAASISNVIATTFPGAIYLGQTLKFEGPVYIGDWLTVTISVLSKKESKPIYTLDTSIASGTTRVSGQAVIKLRGTE